MPSQVYLHSAAGVDRPLDARQTAAVNQALAGSGAHVQTYGAYVETRRAHAAEQTNNAAVARASCALRDADRTETLTKAREASLAADEHLVAQAGRLLGI
nr:hypothetical protein StreXyl84_63060 [Streptomyces sp. Xyl84]